MINPMINPIKFFLPIAVAEDLRGLKKAKLCRLAKLITSRAIVRPRINIQNRSISRSISN